MNRSQKIVLGGALVNMALLMLFPPCDMESLVRGNPVFDAFYPAFAIPPNRIVSANLLYTSLLAVLANAGLAFMLLAHRQNGTPRFDPGLVVIAMGFLNLVVVFLFPPFEAPPMPGRFGSGGFDGFHFALGAGAGRRIFVPLLYIEVLFVLINACAFWLALRDRTAREAVDESIEGLIAEKRDGEAAYEARVQQAVEERIREEARKAGRAAATKANPDRR